MSSASIQLRTGDEARAGRALSARHQLRARLLDEIGALRPGNALPTERQLAQTMKFSRGTVRQALDDLEREGRILRLQGKGTFVADHSAIASQARAPGFAVVLLEVASLYHASLLSGFEQAAHAAGQPALVCNSNNSIDKQASHLLTLLDQKVAGVVLNPSGTSVTPASHLRVLQEAGIPVVLFHRAVPDASAPVLELPAQEIGRIAAQLLVEAGHRRVAYLAPVRSDVSSKYEAGLRQALTGAGGNLVDDLVDYAEFAGPGDYSLYESYLESVLGRLMSRPDRPTALFLTFDVWAERAYMVAQRLGLRVPDDLSIICFGGADRQGAIVQRLAAVTIDAAAAGRHAVQLLIEMRDGKRPIQDDVRIQLPLGVSLGETLGPPPIV